MKSVGARRLAHRADYCAGGTLDHPLIYSAHKEERKRLLSEDEENPVRESAVRKSKSGGSCRARTYDQRIKSPAVKIAQSLTKSSGADKHRLIS